MKFKEEASFKKKNLAPWLGVFFFFSGVMGSLFWKDFLADASLGQHRLPVPAPQMEHFHFGYRSNLADALWLQILQNIDHCNAGAQETKEICRSQGWLFQSLWSASLLDPGFRAIAAVGGLALSVLISDLTGATKLYDRSVRLFPDDWPILYRAAYHSLEEEKDPIKAAHRLRAAAVNGAPAWVQSLAGKIYLQEGRFEMFQQLLQQLKASNVDPEIIQRLEARLSENKLRK